MTTLRTNKDTYQAQGPYHTIDLVPEGAGIYIVIGRNLDKNVSDPRAIQIFNVPNASGKWKVIDVGQSSNIPKRLLHHPRKPQWEEQDFKEIAFLIVPTQNIIAINSIESDLREYFDPPVGVKAGMFHPYEVKTVFC